MRYLYKIFREFNHSDYTTLYKNRLHFDTTIRLPFTIKPINQPTAYPLYYLPTNEMINKMTEIYRLDAKLQELNNNLPPIAQDQYIYDCLIEELFHTNELEGVKSSRKEIIRSSRLLNNNQPKQRFASMIFTYQKLLSGEIKPVTTPSEIRTIYDQIVGDELDDHEKPDGKWFRSEVTHVYKKSGTNQVIHRGITPEAKIIEALNRMIEFMIESNVPALIRIAVGHYYFGYIHPFYDGNGRISRFLSSVYLNHELSPLTAISLSRGCNKYRNKYLQAFEHTNSITNSGEMNYFIDTFLNIISSEQERMVEEMKVKKLQLDQFNEKLSKDQRIHTKELYFGLLFVLGQHHFFSIEKSGLTVQALAEISGKSTQTVRSALRELDEMGYLKLSGKRPVHYAIDTRYIELTP